MFKVFRRFFSDIKDKRFLIIFFVAAFCIIFDQLTKYIIVNTLPLYQSFSVIPGFFDIVHVQNRGAAFGFLNRSDIDWQFWLFAVATVIAMYLILSLTRSSLYNKNLFIAFGLIVGGALGNFIDRIRLAAVTDFLDFYIGVWHWPAFNVADIAICCGAFWACVILWFLPTTPKK